MSWVALARSSEVENGQIVPIDRGDLELVMWRGAHGRVCVMDARCPHQWSYLGFEGAIDVDEIVCTAHFWRFDCEGRGAKLNVFGRRDEKADIAVFACREHDGVIEVDLPG